MNKKKIIIFGGLFAVVTIGILVFVFFKINMSKNSKIGNNSSNQEIEDYILNISSYELSAEIEINSNKNKTKYIVNQKYIDGNKIIQEIIEPTNIQGVKIVKEENKVTLENTKLNLKNIYENYNYIAENDLDLECFIRNYKESDKSKIERKDNIAEMKTESKENKYRKYKTLCVDINTGKPIKLEIRDNNKNTTVYILYKEVKIENSNV